jgi:hypothetical protein
MTAQLLISLVMCVIVTLGFFGVTALYVFNPEAFTGAAEKQLTLITGSLIGAFGQAVAWSIGTTVGSARKTELLAKSIPPPNSDIIELRNEVK